MSEFISRQQVLPEQSPFDKKCGNPVLSGGLDPRSEVPAADGVALRRAGAVGGAVDPAAAVCLFGGMYDGSPTPGTRAQAGSDALKTLIDNTQDPERKLRLFVE